MLSKKHALIGIAALALSASGALAQGKGPVVGVSWSNFQEERWKTDEAAIKAAVEKAGGTYVSADAQSSPAKQLTDIESLIAPRRQGADRAGAGFGGGRARPSTRRSPKASRSSAMTA